VEKLFIALIVAVIGLALIPMARKSSMGPIGCGVVSFVGTEMAIILALLMLKNSN
jgi:hypothetical protein